MLTFPFSGVTPGSQSSGEWDSIHVFEATDRARMSHYKLTSTVMLHLAKESEALGEMDLSGNMTRQVEVDLPVESDASHIANVGRLVEDMELKMRNLLRTLSLPVLCWSVSLTLVIYQRRSTSARPKMWLGNSGVSARSVDSKCWRFMLTPSLQAWLRCPRRIETEQRNWR